MEGRTFSTPFWPVPDVVYPSFGETPVEFAAGDWEFPADGSGFVP